MSGNAFFDTNILVYAFSAGDRRQGTALDLLLAGGTISVQTLNEFVNVMTGKKMRLAWPEVIARLEIICKLCEPAVPMTMEVHRRGLHIASTYRYSVYDSLMLAAALEASCTVFYSEDLRGGQVVEGLSIRNPFSSN